MFIFHLYVLKMILLILKNSLISLKNTVVNFMCNKSDEIPQLQIPKRHFISSYIVSKNKKSP